MIHPTALVDPKASLGPGVEVGAYSVIGPHVSIDQGTVIGHHCVISGRTAIGRDNRISHFVSLGEAPQDKKYDGEPTQLVIGDRNRIREFCTFNVGTAQGGGITRLGSDNWIMAYVHLAHDCIVGNNTIFANNAQLAGHVSIGDFAVLGGFTVVHQFCKIGPHAISAMGTIVLQDIPAFVTAAGNPAAPKGVNSEGLRRRGFSPHAIETIRRAYRALYRESRSLEEARTFIAALTDEVPAIGFLLDSLSGGTRGIVR